MKSAIAVLVIFGALARPASSYEQDDLARLKQTGGCDGCDLSGAMLRGANLSKAMLAAANLSGADLVGANLNGAVLWNANLRSVRFFAANLNGADVSGADLTGAHLGQTDLRGAYFFDTDMRGVIFEPRVDRFPDYSSIVVAKNLDKMIFTVHPYGLTNLRNLFRNYGHRDLERKLTYALKVSERVNAGCIRGLHDDGICTKRTLMGRVEAFGNYVLFEATSDYGMSPGRPLLIMLLLVVVFAAPYMLALIGRTDRNAGIWQVWPTDRINRDRGMEGPRRVTARGFGIPLWGLYFSLLSAFHIGWRDLNVGTWIARINPEEYALRPTGWVKVVSGIQSLISVYLVALWILSYFGRPFE